MQINYKNKEKYSQYKTQIHLSESKFYVAFEVNL